MLGADHQGLIAKPCSTYSSTCGDGWEINRAEATSGESYQQNGILAVNMTKSDFYYSCCPAPYPVLSCELQLLQPWTALCRVACACTVTIPTSLLPPQTKLSSRDPSSTTLRSSSCRRRAFERLALERSPVTESFGPTRENHAGALGAPLVLGLLHRHHQQCQKHRY